MVSAAGGGWSRQSGNIQVMVDIGDESNRPGPSGLNFSRILAVRQPLLESDTSMPALASTKDTSSEEDNNSEAYALKPWYALEK